MVARPLLVGGLLLLVLGLLGEFLIFPGMIASDGDEFAAQISSSGDIETFNDYDVGDSVTIVDMIARIQLDEGQTRVWLASIGAADTDIAFRFNGDLLDDFKLGWKNLGQIFGRKKGGTHGVREVASKALLDTMDVGNEAAV